MTRQTDRVMETSTTTGTGNLTTAGAVTGFITFAAVYALNEPFDYCVEGVDSNGTPTGEWEVGEGYLSASTTFVRATVTGSSNSGALVNFSAGTKRLFVVLPANEMVDKGNAIGVALCEFLI